LNQWFLHFCFKKLFTVKFVYLFFIYQLFLDINRLGTNSGKMHLLRYFFSLFASAQSEHLIGVDLTAVREELVASNDSKESLPSGCGYWRNETTSCEAEAGSKGPHFVHLTTFRV